jgi:hypothetical protein
MTNKDYLLQIAKQRECASFVIRDGRGDVVHISDAPASFQDKFQELEMFLNNNSGVYKVQLRTETGKGLYPGGKDKERSNLIIGEYTVMLEKAAAQQEKAITGFDFMQGINGFEIMRSYEGEKQTLKDEIAQLRMENMLLKRDIDSVKSDYERKLSEAKSTDNRIMGVLGKLSDVISPVPGRPVNGISDTMTNNTTDKKQRLIEAINELTAIDPNFTENIEGLASLAKNNPAMYNQAVSMLKNFS